MPRSSFLLVAEIAPTARFIAQRLRLPSFTAIRVDKLPPENGLPEPAGEDADPR